MEISVGKSGGSNTKSLDLETLYKAKVSNKKGNAKKEKSCGGLENGEGVVTKKRKSRKEVALSSFEQQTQRKKSRNSVDEVDGPDSSSGHSVGRSVSGLSQKLNGDGGLNGIGLSIGDDDNSTLVPKRPRGSVGRNKFANDHILNPLAASISVGKVAKIKDEPVEVPQREISATGDAVDTKATYVEKIVKLNGNSGVKARTDNKQKVVVGSKGKQNEFTSSNTHRHAKKDVGDLVVNDHLLQPNVSLRSKEKVSQSKDELAEILENKVSCASEPLTSKSASDDQTGKLNGKSTGKVRTSVKKTDLNGLNMNRLENEELAVVGSSQDANSEGCDSIVGNKDPSSKKSSSSCRKRKIIGSGNETVAKKVEPSVDKKLSTCDLDPEDDLEQNAARMLSSRFDPNCTGFESKNRTLALSSVNEMSLLAQSTGYVGSEVDAAVSNSSSADAADRILRPRRQQKGKGTSRKRRHFYEIHSLDLDAHWFLNRRIKIFWPLDESWYYGLVNGYDAEKDLHHIKYDDRDEEWISLENERFKLLLLPSENPDKPRGIESNLEDAHTEGTREDTESRGLRMIDEAFMASHMESEPIISWLACSSLRVKSSPSAVSKKQKVSHLPYEPSDKYIDMDNDGDMSLIQSKTGNLRRSSAFLDKSSDERTNEKSVLNSIEGHSPIVYVRRRYRKFSDEARSLSFNNIGSASLSGAASLAPAQLHWSMNSLGALELDMLSLECKTFEICISLCPILTYVLGADILCFLRGVLLFQHGAIVTMWPTVRLEVLFVDNIVGLRLFLFEGSLNHAVAFIFLVMSVFRQPEKHVQSMEHQMPVTSIRFKLSFSQNFTKQKVFAYYSFSKLSDSNWLYLDSEFQPHCLLTKQLALPECTYENIKLLEGGNRYLQIPSAGQNTPFEVLHMKSNPSGVPMPSGFRSSYGAPRSRPSTIISLKHGNLPPFALSFPAAPNFFLSLHLKLLMERSITSFSVQDHDAGDADISIEGSPKSLPTIPSIEAPDSGVVRTTLNLQKDTDAVNVKEAILVNTSISSKAAESTPVETETSEKCKGNDQQSHQFEFLNNHSGSSGHNLKDMSVEIPSDAVDKDCRKTPSAHQVSDLTWNLTDGIICSPNPTGPRSLWHRSRFSPGSPSFGDPSHAWANRKTDFIGNGFGNGPKKPRTQVQYTLPSGGRDLNSKHRGQNQIGLPFKRIRKANDRRTSDASKGPRRNLELVACDANLLINGGDKGWRECGARVFLEAADQNEWKLAVKRNGEVKYSYKVHQDLQPGSTNRYTHAMMWKGGKNWALEFLDRSQWFIFKEMHEECHNRNIRAASIKNIPIPGVRLIEEFDDDQEERPFVRSPRYFRQVETDVEMAMDTSHVLYDMDSGDEEWISRNKASWKMEGSEDDMITDEFFEKIMDKLEKVSFAQKRDHFTTRELEDLIGRVSPVDVTKSIYEHWREKRQSRGMPLIRQLQPPLWERYQQLCREWERSKPKATTGSQEKASSGDKPPMFAFCLKPRGLELLNKGSKHRPHKRISLSGHNNSFLGYHDAHHSSGRRVNGHGFGDEKAEYSDVSPMLNKKYSPRDGVGPGHLSLNGDASDWNPHQPRIHRNNSKKIRAAVSPKVVVASSSTTLRKAAGKRNNGRGNAFADWHNNQQNHPHRQQLLLGGSDLDEFRLRDASSAAKHACNMAKLKRERAQKLMLSADLAIHKAVSALMTSEAIKACTEVDHEKSTI